MELLYHLLPDTKNLQLERWQFDKVQGTITLIVCAVQTVINCPVCNHPTHKIHSRYERKLADGEPCTWKSRKHGSEGAS
ncbi:transposase (plasmid) [Fischerella sp. NIES-4106]|nr:transposase [Fischerella sp. NIES-4106]